ncbi:MAG: hypothetical protein H7095_07455 [Pseudopedobacter sp.]|nr:hypothetical protein [Deinococcales bacterium]
MANLVYNMVCDAFADLISRRAAENLVKEALRDIGSNPDRVTALEMQELLRKGIFKRLQKIIPVVKAKGEIKRLLRNLEKTLAQPVTGAEDSEDWDEPDAEAVDLSPWEVETRNGQTPQSQTLLGQSPARAEGPPEADSSGGMPVLELSRSPSDLEPDLELRLVGVSSPNPNATGLDFLSPPTLTTLPNPLNASLAPAAFNVSAAQSKPSPNSATRKEGEAEMSTDENLAVPMLSSSKFPPSNPQPHRIQATSGELNLPEPLDRNPESRHTEPAESELVLVGEEGDGTLGKETSEFDSEFDADLFGDAEDLFEFEAVDLAGMNSLNVPLEPKPALREYKRQDAILSRIALENGVSEVMLSLRSGEVLHARVNRVEPARLAGAVAHAAQPADGGVAPGLFYADLGENFILVSPLDDQVLLSILAASNTNIARLLSEIIALKEEL